ncbi:MAG: hypothetical protein WCP87_04330, partial [Atribacterota bacterium]
AHRGAIVERWFSSTAKADNGSETTEDEGLSSIYWEDGSHKEKILFKEALECMGELILGKKTMEKYGGWTMFSKFFDTMEPLHFHLHQDDRSAAKVGRIGKPEAYYFPSQLNNHTGYFPYTFFGLNPKTSRENVIRCLQNWDRGDNDVLGLSKAYRLKIGSGWNISPGILHAPGSLLTYEPQKNSDVAAIFQSMTWNTYRPWNLLVKDVPLQYQHDLNYIVDLIDWEANLDPDFVSNRYCEPKPVKSMPEMEADGYQEFFLSDRSKDFSAKELTVFPKRTVVLHDSAPYGLIVIQGHGKYGKLTIESPTLIRFGQMTNDELFVTVEAAQNGVTVTNLSERENLVILRHYGPAL